ncbi:hypothetical protein BpHYR1_010419 [Brachionus plicatilis]|uniref:Uncharacterized protein n=1 Tax=Brachionus plicatilis TaxID=10195 RepID=A0A3M7QY23_BRAPC|nr:hypothetical protein BpHYR1_010419 [Brachionus plicatilis]
MQLNVRAGDVVTDFLSAFFNKVYCQCIGIHDTSGVPSEMRHDPTVQILQRSQRSTLKHSSSFSQAGPAGNIRRRLSGQVTTKCQQRANFFTVRIICDIATSLSISLESRWSLNTCSNTSNERDRIDGPKELFLITSLKSSQSRS